MCYRKQDKTIVMKTVLFSLMMLVSVSAPAQLFESKYVDRSGTTDGMDKHEYSDFIRKFCIRKQGKWVGGKLCQDLVLTILKKTHSKPKFVCNITDSLGTGSEKIKVGDYVLFRNHVNKAEVDQGSSYNGARWGNHTAVVIGKNPETGLFIIAHQNTSYEGVVFNDIDFRSLGGSIMVCTYERGRHSGTILPPKNDRGEKFRVLNGKH
jgi:hypothetical protein